MLHKPSTCRLRQRCTPRTFRERFACVVQHHPELTAEEIAAKARVRYDRLLRYCTDPASHVPAEVLRDVVLATGRIDLFDALLEDLGYHAVPLDRANEGESLTGSCLDVQAAVGKLAEGARAAMRDHHQSNDERLELLECVRRVRRELADVEACLQVRPVAVLQGARR